mmetsp:Transcript_6878/g.25697  ORF Transcript_6878/g.25697 Transcript_6878/m.25697 type:complete len:98 (-) Transcript_6878:218-511(-)
MYSITISPSLPTPKFRRTFLSIIYINHINNIIYIIPSHMTHQNIPKIHYTANMLNQNHNSVSLNTFLKLAQKPQPEGENHCLCQVHNADTIQINQNC